MPTTRRKLVAYINVFFYDNLIPQKNHYSNFIFSIVNVFLIMILCDNHNLVSITFYLAGHSIMTVIVTSKVIATRVKNIVAKRMDKKDPNAASNHSQHKDETTLDSAKMNGKKIRRKKRTKTRRSPARPSLSSSSSNSSLSPPSSESIRSHNVRRKPFRRKQLESSDYEESDDPNSDVDSTESGSQGMPIYGKLIMSIYMLLYRIFQVKR